MKLSKNPVAVIDADVIVYKCAHVCQKELPMVIDDGTVERTKFYFPQTLGYQLIDMTIEAVRDRLSPSKVTVVLSPQDKQLNYRTHVKHASRTYKGKRKERPFFYPHMRSYIINNYSAIVADKDEADDEIGRMVYSDYMHAVESGEDAQVVVCSIDKDFKQFPGYFFDMGTNNTTYSDYFGYLTYDSKQGIDGRGFLFFCAQMLMGDTADNILGVPGVGPKKSYELLHDADTYREAWKRVIDKYKQKNIPDREIQANATLLWITHEENRLLPHTPSIQELF